MEKIEILDDCVHFYRFVHITFKQNRHAYRALIENENRSKRKTYITCIRPADTHHQPDWTDSPFFKLNDDCFLEIIKYCDFETIADLSSVCTKFSNILRTRHFANKTKEFKMESDYINRYRRELYYFSKLVNCIQPENFHLRIYNRLWNESVLASPMCTINMDAPKTELFIDSYYLMNLGELNMFPTIAKRINSVHIYQRINDARHEFEFETEYLREMPLPNVKEFTIRGYSSTATIPNPAHFVDSFSQLERITFYDCKVDWEESVLYFIQHATKLRHISFENCCFEPWIQKKQLMQAVELLKKGGRELPLCMRFDRIQVTIEQNHGPNRFFATVETDYGEINKVNSHYM